MIAEGFVEEGERMVKAIRDRYDGEKRNPWNEIECGNNYARSMASYALMSIYSGFTFDMTKRHIGFVPLAANGKYVFSACESWGMAEFEQNGLRLSVVGDPLSLCSVSIPDHKHITSVIVDGTQVDFSVGEDKILLGCVEIREELRLI